ncbi:LTA synthase family protein [Jiulongibacter sp. NS-SX5]|uniref:LTA synthase family protein n=1 Tax=Jiulongibacter sp. NS-SX5 TaxID=3463854 RepID=UPI00405A2CA3
MRERIQFLFIYFGFWVVYFLCARFVFLVYHIDQTKLLTLETLAGVFWNGIRMDMSMAGYLSIIPFIWITFSNFIKKSIFESSLFGYTLVMVFVLTLIIVVDLEVFNVWDYRLDATPLNYLNTPKEAWASVSSSPVLRLLISYILLLIVASYFVYRIIANKMNSWNFTKKWRFIPWAFLLTLALIIPIRGGIGIAPMNQSTVYFSSNNFANISAVNACWNFFSSLVNKTYNKVNPYTYLPKEEIEKNLNELYLEQGKKYNILKPEVENPNVLVLIWESFTEKVVDEKFDGKYVTPYFNRLKKEGVYFSNAYASGDRTDKGIVSVLSGYPAQPTYSIIKEPSKTQKLPILSKDFQNRGYNSEFYYGGETEFANIKSYLLTADFENIIDLDNFSEEQSDTKWGVHDELIFDKFLADHQSARKSPFFSTLLTISSHEPFDVPLDSTIFEGSDEQNLYLNSLYYTDQEFGRFIDSAKTQPWWQNSIVIVVGDHGHRLPETNSKSESFRIPLLWTGGAVKNSTVVDDVVSQNDIAKSLLNILQMNSQAYQWSKDMFRTILPSWAFFSFNDGFGYVKNDIEILFDNIGKKEINISGNVSNDDLNKSKSLQQKYFQDYLDK